MKSTLEDYPISENLVLPINRYDAAGGIVVWKDNVLILYRKLKDDYKLPKGHIEPAEAPLAAAQREVAEESGYIGLEILHDLGEKTADFVRNGKHTIRSEHYYLMQVTEETQQIPHEEDRDPVWVSWDEALEMLSFEQERYWIRRARAALSA
jgi:8-oxo-dGTP pyrophosphatase MutT (NUDIX family)